MVTNLPAEARAKFAKYMEAKTLEEKIKALEEFISSVPKHKGTENLLYWAKKRLAELREELEERKRKKTGRGGPSFFIEKEGAAQVVLLGFTKAGKSALLRRLTGAKVEVSDYPYTTKTPVPGMLQYEDIQFQLVEAPSIIPEGGGWNTRVIGLAKNADGLIIVLDVSQDPIDSFTRLSSYLKDHGLLISRPRGYVVIEKSRGIKGIQIISYGRLMCTHEDIKKLLESYRIYNAVVKVYGEVELDDVEKALFEHTMYKPTMVLLNKIDLISRSELKYIVEKLRSLVPSEIPIMCVSALTGENLGYIGSTLFKILELIRVYTKPPTGKPSEKPLVLRRGATVLDVAKAIHSDLYEKFAYARIWGPSAKYPGQRVGANHVVEDGDIVEINIKK